MLNLFVKRAYSKMVLRIHGMDESGVRFPVGPQFKNQILSDTIKAYAS